MKDFATKDSSFQTSSFVQNKANCGEERLGGLGFVLMGLMGVFSMALGRSSV